MPIKKAGKNHNELLLLSLRVIWLPYKILDIQFNDNSPYKTAHKKYGTNNLLNYFTIICIIEVFA